MNLRTVKLLKSPEIRRYTGKQVGNHLLGTMETYQLHKKSSFKARKTHVGYWIFSESGRRIRFTQVLFMVHMSLMMPGSGVRSHASQIRKLLATCMRILPD